MTKEDLLQKLTEIEWDDFECKRAQDKLPDDVWSTVSAFSNTSGGWIIFGVDNQKTYIWLSIRLEWKSCGFMVTI